MGLSSMLLRRQDHVAVLGVLLTRQKQGRRLFECVDCEAGQGVQLVERADRRVQALISLYPWQINGGRLFVLARFGICSWPS